MGMNPHEMTQSLKIFNTEHTEHTEERSVAFVGVLGALCVENLFFLFE